MTFRRAPHAFRCEDARPTRRALLTLGCAHLAASVPLVAACHRTAETPAVRARFGVFFGGQVQEREEVSLILDRARQSMGVRLEFAAPPETTSRVRWELEKPAAGKSGTGGKVVDYGEVSTRAGEPVLDVLLAFRESDRPGDWRIRVALDGKNVLDRAFKVVPPGDSRAEQ